MSCVQLSEGVFQVVYPLALACGPSHPELSKSYVDMASKSFTFTFACTHAYSQLHVQLHHDVVHTPTCQEALVSYVGHKCGSTWLC